MAQPSGGPMGHHRTDRRPHAAFRWTFASRSATDIFPHMAKILHDAAVRESIRARVNALQPDTPRAWGKMTADQMLRHCNLTLEGAMGRTLAESLRIPLPNFVLKFMILRMPWPKGAPTHPDWVAGDRYDFQTERARCLSLINEFAQLSLDAHAWPPSPGFGKATGKEWSELQAKHLDHHLRQFNL